MDKEFAEEFGLELTEGKVEELGKQIASLAHKFKEGKDDVITMSDEMITNGTMPDPKMVRMLETEEADMIVHLIAKKMGIQWTKENGYGEMRMKQNYPESTDMVMNLLGKRKVNEGHGKSVCPKCDGEGCDHCDGKGYHINEMPNRRYMEKINTLLKDYHGKFKWRDEVLYVTKEIEKDVRDIISKDKGHSYMVKVSKNPMREEVELVTEGRPKQDDDYVPAATGGDKLRAQLLSTQKRQYSAKDIESMARKYKVKLDGDPIGGKQWGGDWQIALKGGITMEYQYGPNSMYIKGWKFDRKAIKNYIAKYANEHETPRDYAPMGGKVLIGGFESAFELISEELLMEGAPANSVSAGNVNLDPFKKKRKNAKVQTETFGGKKVFVVSPERFYDSRLGKSRYARYEKYVGNDKLGEAIRQYGLANPKAPIILKNSGNGAMLYLKYGK